MLGFGGSRNLGGGDPPGGPPSGGGPPGGGSKMASGGQNDPKKPPKPAICQCSDPFSRFNQSLIRNTGVPGPPPLGGSRDPPPLGGAAGPPPCGGGPGFRGSGFAPPRGVKSGPRGLVPLGRVGPPF